MVGVYDHQLEDPGSILLRTAPNIVDRNWEKHVLWEKDPKLVPFKESSKYGRWVGYPGPPNRKASEALVKYILVDMYAQAIKGMKAEDAVKWAEGELKKAYA